MVPIIIIAFFILMTVVAPIIFLFQPISFGYKLLFGTILLGELFFAMFISKYEMLETLITSAGMKLTLFLTVFFIMFIAQTSMEIESVEKGEYKGTKIVTSDSTYTSTDSAFYIGQTTNYVFFYYKKDKHTTIIPTREIKKLELYSK